MKRKYKKKKEKSGRKSEFSKKSRHELSVEPTFKLVCSSLEELRGLISTMEDELDDLESTKKRLGRWYYKKEAVKDLHSTLIRLLNELSPWEPKLIKAHQRNRLRLKKEFDDFKKQPEYSNFVREECISSSSDNDEDEDKDNKEHEVAKELCSPDRLEQEDLEHMVPRGLWIGASTREFGTDLPAQNHLKHSLLNPEKDVNLPPRVEAVSFNMTSTDTKQLCGTELSPTNQSRDLAPVSPRSPILHPASILPKRYTPIPTLLVKSVGNKVTLMKRPFDFSAVSTVDVHRTGTSLSPPNVAVGNTNPSKAQSPLCGLQQGAQQTQALSQPRTTAALPPSTQTKPMQSEPKSPIQVVYKVPEGLGHLAKKDTSGPIKFSIHPVMDQNTGKKIMQQVVILPSTLLKHKEEEKATSVSQQQSKAIQVAVSQAVSPLCMSTDVPGFSIPENRIPVQQVAPLRDARTVSSPPPSILPCLHQGTTSTAVGVKATQTCNVAVPQPQALTSNPTPISSLSSAFSTEPVKAEELNQELKTVCIRDSQSILVTTRGGNTGIVKVQPPSDQSGFCSFPSSPVITISPQFKAFLVSKASPTLSPSAQPQTLPASVPPVSLTLSQKQTPTITKSPSTVAIPLVPAVTGDIPITDPGSHNSTAVITQGSITSASPIVGPKITQVVQTTAASFQIQTPVIKNTALPSLSKSNIPQLHTQEFVSKTGLKRGITDEHSQVPKFILVTPSSCSAPNIALPKGAPSLAKSVQRSRVMATGQLTVTSPTSSIGSIPQQSMATTLSGQALAASLPSHALKMVSNAVPPLAGISSEDSSPARNIAPPSGFQLQLSGKTTTIGQSIGALSYSPSKCKPVLVPDPPTATTNRPTPITSLNSFINCSSQPEGRGPLNSSSQFLGLQSLSTVSHASCSSSISTVPTLPAVNSSNKDLSVLAGVLSNGAPAQVANAVEISPTPLPSAPASCTAFTTSATGTVQQRVVINTSTPLAAGTQILLNNACFVVPPQGLGPGSHVLIIPSAAPQQVPTASASSSGASLPHHEAGNPTVASLAPVLPHSRAGPTVVPATTTPLVALSQSSSALHATPVQATGTPSLSSTVVPSNTNVVSALPSSPVVQAGNFASPAADTPTLALPLSKSGTLAAVASPVAASGTSFISAPVAVRLSSPSQAACLSAVSATVASTFPPHVPGPLSSMPVLSSPSAIALPVPALFTSNCSVPRQQVVTEMSLGPGILPLQTAVGVAAASTRQPQTIVHVGLGNALIKKAAPVMQTVLSGSRTQVLPTVAVPPIVSAVSRIQTLPVATVPPIGSSVNSIEKPSAGTVPSRDSTTGHLTEGQQYL